MTDIPHDGTADEYEEISGEEVDRIVAALQQLIDSVESVNIQGHLEEALNSVYYLYYEDEGDESVANAA